MQTFVIKHRPKRYTTPTTRRIIVAAVGIIALLSWIYFIAGCAHPVAMSECRHIAPYAADVASLDGQVPVRIGLRGFHAWAEARIDGQWQVVSAEPGPVVVADDQYLRGRGERYFAIGEWYQFREGLRCKSQSE